jgi:hypothetical protein
MTQLWIPIIASVVSATLGALLAYLWTTRNDRRKDKKQILNALMAHRGVTVRDENWTRALNLIDLTFYDNKKIKELRVKYFSSLRPPTFDTGDHNKILLDLIFEMAKDIGYSSLKQTDIMDYYYPQLYEPQPPLNP